MAELIIIICFYISEHFHASLPVCLFWLESNSNWKTISCITGKNWSHTLISMNLDEISQYLHSRTCVTFRSNLERVTLEKHKVICNIITHHLIIVPFFSFFFFFLVMKFIALDEIYTIDYICQWSLSATVLAQVGFKTL